MEAIVVSYLLSVGLAVVKLKPHQHGQKGPVLAMSRAAQYFTLYGQLWACIAWYTGNPVALSVALVVETLVFLLYFGFSIVDPCLLSWESPELTRKVVSVRPPTHPLLLCVWMGLLFQHLGSPLIVFFYAKNHVHGPVETVVASIACIAYVCINEGCWRIQGTAAYPVQGHIRNSGLYMEACVAFVTLSFIVGLLLDIVY